MAGPKGLPFGLEEAQPVFDRVTELAGELFGGLAALAIVHKGRMWRTRDPEGRLPRTSLLAEQVVATGQALWVEDLRLNPVSAGHPLVAVDGGLRCYAGVPIRGHEGNLLGVLSVVGREVRPRDDARLASLEKLARFAADECDRQRGQRDLEQSQATLAAFVATVPAAVMMTDTEMRILEASPMWLENFQITLEQARGRTIYEIAPGFAAFRGAYERCLLGETLTGGRVASPWSDGTVRYLRSHMLPWRQADGGVGGLIAAAVDITDMVEALERIEASEKRLQMAVELADLHVWEIDYRTRTLITAGAAETFFDAPFDEAAFMADTSITIDPRDRAVIGPEWEKAVLENRPYRPEYRVARQDGKEVWATCQVKLEQDARGRPARLVGAMQNITARKANEAALLKAKEEAEAANAAKSTFLATMSHEIRTPLNGVLGMAQAMEMDELSPAQRERLGLIRQSGETLLAILNDVLDLSKIEAGRLEVEAIDFDMSGLARGAHGAFTALAERKGLDFRLSLEPGALGRYRSDPTRIRQILYNLISNALKFTEAGGVEVTVARAGDHVRFDVRDTGVGMAPEALQRLFEKFEQADASTTRRFGGTGLGLAICRELARLLGGRIEAASRLGEGSILTLLLPLERLGEETPALAAPPPPAREPDGAGRAARVLAAEDNAINQLVLKTLLGHAGIEPVVVEDGAAALEAWREGGWDLILMDVHMPRMDGLTATRAIRAEEARRGLKRIPIVALTANAMAHQVAEYRAAGMDGFIAKPIEAARLFEAVTAALEAGGEGERRVS